MVVTNPAQRRARPLCWRRHKAGSQIKLLYDLYCHRSGPRSSAAIICVRVRVVTSCSIVLFQLELLAFSACAHLGESAFPFTLLIGRPFALPCAAQTARYAICSALTQGGSQAPADSGLHCTSDGRSFRFRLQRRPAQHLFVSDISLIQLMQIITVTSCQSDYCIVQCGINCHI